MINKEALNDLADYIEGGELMAPFNMSGYGTCAVGQYIRREVRRDGMDLDTGEITTEAMRSVREVFGVESGSLEWAFAFGPEWGNSSCHTTINDRGGAARRLRELATTGKVPVAEKWKEFETAGSRSESGSDKFSVARFDERSEALV